MKCAEMPNPTLLPGLNSSAEPLCRTNCQPNCQPKQSAEMFERIMQSAKKSETKMTEKSKRNRIPAVVFIGMPASGKSRIGCETALLSGLDFVDADEMIERAEHKSIPDIFKQNGEKYFRKIENKIIEKYLSDFDGVLSLGGGAPMNRKTRYALKKYVRKGGKIVYLLVNSHDAAERIARSSNRPLLAENASQKWDKLFEQRDPVFRRTATDIISTYGKTPKKVAGDVMDTIKERVVKVGGEQPYEVRIGNNVMRHLPDLLGKEPLHVALIHTSKTQRHSDRARTILRRANYEVSDIVIPDAEAGKTMEVASSVWKRLGQEGFTRSDAIVGLGGGAATDLAGFVAATWMRGIKYVNCPTSLLAMVDASTGGKTGINTDEGKNLVGCFYTPAGVLADLTCLETLPNDIFVEGLGEVVKSGFIMDKQILKILEENADALRSFDPENTDDDLSDVISELIERSVTVKACHVSSDLKEAGLREFLNYGHTFGHAIEKIEHFSMRHGQAISAGMVFAAELGCKQGYISSELVEYHRKILSSLGLRTSWDNGSFEDVLEIMHRDKKARGNMLRFIVLESAGHPTRLEDPDEEAVREAFESVKKQKNA